MKDFLSSGEWFVYRDHTLTVWGEYEPVDSWSGYRRLNETLRYEIHISGKRKGWGCTPHWWYAKLRYNDLDFKVPSSHPSCKSKRNALDLADKALTVEVFKEACKFFMSHCRVECVVRIEEDNTIPLLSSFGHIPWSKKILPNGEYVTARNHGREGITWSNIKLDYWGWSGGGTEKRFNHWLKPEVRR